MHLFYETSQFTICSTGISAKMCLNQVLVESNLANQGFVSKHFYSVIFDTKAAGLQLHHLQAFAMTKLRSSHNEARATHVALMCFTHQTQYGG